MPIKNLTDGSHLGFGLPRIATLYKGAPKEKRAKNGREYEVVGKDLDYFRAEFEPQFEHLRPIWEDIYGDKPKAFENVLLAGETVDEAFPSWMEEWNSSMVMVHRCDGEHQHQWYNFDSQMYMRAKIACASPANKDGVVEKQRCNCNRVARLNLLLPEFLEAAGVLGTVSATTHSINDIIVVYQYLARIQQLQGTLQGIPFVFGRAPKEIGAPKADKNGKVTGRIKTTKAIFFIYATGAFTSSALIPALTGAMPNLSLPEPPKPAIDVEKAKRQLGSGSSGARRLGAPQPTQTIVEPQTTWIDDPEQWNKFQSWADKRFNSTDGDILAAFNQAATYPVNKISDWREDGFVSMAAVIVAHCNYDLALIEKVTSSGYDSAVWDAAQEIVDRVIASEEAELEEEVG